MTADAVQTMLDGIHALLARCGNDEARRFADGLPQRADPRRAVTPHRQPVVDYLDNAAYEHGNQTSNTVLSQLQAMSPRLAWAQSYSRAQVSERFLARYAWAELVGPRGPIASHTLVCGFLLLGPDIEYPEHAHAPEELYIPLTPGSQWRKDAGPWRARASHEVIHHPPWVSHAMRTGTQPMVALYLWRDGDLHQPPTFDV